MQVTVVICSAKTAFLFDIGHMVTSCCHGNVKSSDCGLNVLFYIRGNNDLCKNIFIFKLIK